MENNEEPMNMTFSEFRKKMKEWKPDLKWYIRHYFNHILEYPGNKRRSIMQFIERGKHGSSYADRFGVDDYLIKLLPDMLSKYRKEASQMIEMEEADSKKLMDIINAFETWKTREKDCWTYDNEFNFEKEKLEKKELLDRMKQIFDEDFFEGLWWW